MELEKILREIEFIKRMRLIVESRTGCMSPLSRVSFSILN